MLDLLWFLKFISAQVHVERHFGYKLDYGSHLVGEATVDYCQYSEKYLWCTIYPIHRILCNGLFIRPNYDLYEDRLLQFTLKVHYLHTQIQCVVVCTFKDGLWLPNTHKKRRGIRRLCSQLRRQTAVSRKRASSNTS